MRAAGALSTWRAKPQAKEAVIPSLSRDLGIVLPLRRADDAERFRLRRAAPALNMTDPRADRRLLSIPDNSEKSLAPGAARPENGPRKTEVAESGGLAAQR